MHEAVGKTDLAKGREAKVDDIYFIMSISKQITATRVLMDIDSGKYSFNTCVADIIPEFGIRGKHRITIGQMLNHTSGLNTEIPFGLEIDKLGDIEEVTAMIGKGPLLSKPGEIVTYNPYGTMSVVASVVKRLDERKRPFRQILAEDVFQPLGMENTALGLPDRFRERIVPVVVRDCTPSLIDADSLESVNFLANEQFELPAGSVVSTALDIFHFAEMLRRGGELDGVRLLSPGIIKIATSNQTGDRPNHLFDLMREIRGWPTWPAYLGSTFFIRGEGIFPTFLGLNTSPGTFAGLGAGSTMFWVDPERDLTFVFLSAGLMEEIKHMERCQHLSDLVVAAVTN